MEGGGRQIVGRRPKCYGGKIFLLGSKVPGAKGGARHITNVRDSGSRLIPDRNGGMAGEGTRGRCSVM